MSAYIGLIVLFVFAHHLAPVQAMLNGGRAMRDGVVERMGQDRRAQAVVFDVRPRPPVLTDATSEPGSLTASAAYALDVRSGAALWAKNADEARPIASITKLAALMVARSTGPDLEHTAVIQQQEYERVGGRTFAIGQIVGVRDLYAASIIASDNTAVRVLARETGLSSGEFVRAMNEQANAIGLSQTFFSDPTGLSSGNQSTARDVALLAQAAFQDDFLRELSGMRSYEIAARNGSSKTISSTNQLIGGADKVVAGKTGYVVESGYNLVVEFERNGNRIIIVVLGSGTTDDRFRDAATLAHWVWNNYSWE